MTAPHRRIPWGWIALAVSGGLALLSCSCALGTLLGLRLASPAGGYYAGSGPRIALIRVEGVIVSGKQPLTSLYGTVAAADTIVEHLDQAARNPGIVAVILSVNSPGGGVVPSDEIYRAVRRVQAAGKPVVVTMGEMAASGGYYISASADHIVANPNTTTGSIGVIMTVTNVQDLYEKIGVRQEVIKSSSFKDIGSPTRPLTEEERAILQDLVDETYGSFVQIVADGRGMPVEQVRALADGRIYSGRQALELGLVDELGGLPEAQAAARDLAHSPNAVLVEPPQPTLLDLFLNALLPAPSPDLKTLLGLDQPVCLQYLLVR